MILGIGTDLVDIRRIENSIRRYGEAFLDRVFTPLERARCDARKDKSAAYAKRFAAKEAFVKALGTGIRDGIAWCDMEVANLASGKPVLSVTGESLRHLQARVPQGWEAQIDLSLSDDAPYAQAFCIISAVQTAVTSSAI